MGNFSFTATRKSLYDFLLSLPGNLFPLVIDSPVRDSVSGCDFDLLVLDEEYGLVLRDRHNASGIEYSAGQMTAARLAAIIGGIARKRPESVPENILLLSRSVGVEKETLRDYVDETAEYVADKKGMNVSYCESIDLGDTFPTLLDVAIGDYDEDDASYIEQTLRFLAENGRYLPESLKEEPFETLVAYVRNNEDKILNDIRSECDSYQAECGEEEDGEEDWEESED